MAGFDLQEGKHPVIILTGQETLADVDAIEAEASENGLSRQDMLRLMKAKNRIMVRNVKDHGGLVHNPSDGGSYGK